VSDRQGAALAATGLLVVDPRATDGTLAEDMTARGVHVSTVSSTIDGLVVFGRHNPAAVIVASDADGLAPDEFVRAIRRHANPFVIAVLDSCRAGDDAGIAGGNAAIERPYHALDVWGMLEETQGAFRAPTSLRVGSLELDPPAYSVKVDGRRIRDLPLKEFELLRALLEHAPGVLPDLDVWPALWGDEPINGNTLAVHVARLRHRLEGVARIRRIRGRGYLLTVD
jgi:DNA-binding response OmpR family regulator